MERKDAAHWISRFKMTTHVEGGSFAEVYRSDLSFEPSAASGFQGKRNYSTHIYFLLEQNQFSAFHRILSDELWHFYEGDPLVIYEISEEGILTEHLLGNIDGYNFFTMIRAGSWFASAPAADGIYSLVGCTVSPGFDFADFELADRNTLAAQYPQHKELISQFTR